jgi:Antitoxin-like ribbon-helix-helix
MMIEFVIEQAMLRVSEQAKLRTGKTTKVRSMTKIGELQRALQETISPTPPALAAPREPVSRAAAVAASREGRVHVGGYFHPQVRKSLRMIQVQTDENFETLILRALNELFRAHNVPVVDQDC